jgi:hypothetical protein
MASRDILIDGFGRVDSVVHSILRDVTEEQLSFRADPDANTIGWLIWHLARVQDAQVADAAGHEQLWTADEWVERFGLPFSRLATGYGQSTSDVEAVHVGVELLREYFEAVHARTLGYIESLRDSDLERVIDTNYNPPVTVSVRLVSILADDLQHAGQASYVKGIASRAGVPA